VLQPGVYFAINSPVGVVGTEPAVARDHQRLGLSGPVEQMQTLADDIGERSLFARTGGARAWRSAWRTSSRMSGTAVALWYHFAIMFRRSSSSPRWTRARVGRFMLQDLLGNLWAPLGRTSWYPSVLLSSTLVVAAWGYFLYQGVIDPLGGINILWPLFGIANQLLAAIALSVATTFLIRGGRARYAWTTLLPLAWLLAVTMTAGYQKIFSADPGLGFLAQADKLSVALDAGTVVAEKIRDTRTQIFNLRLDAAVTGLFMGLVGLILIEASRAFRVLRGPPGAAGRRHL
jgi:carbon starvation protein